MPERVRITDVSPRDGLQNEPGVIPTADKVRLIELLCATGVDEVEVTSFVSPKWVPQLADSDAVFGALWKQSWNSPKAQYAFERGPLLSVLVPNVRGMVPLIKQEVNSGYLLIKKASVFTAASETFAKKNTNASIAETMDRFAAVIESRRGTGILIRGYVSCVIACPFEGPISPQRVAEVSKQLVDLGIDELDLGDTIGAGTPETITAMLKAVDQVCPIVGGRVPVTLHLHDTFGRAADCVKAALDLGVRSFDGSVAGLGGCPYASTPGKRAPGNISTETLVKTVEAAGYTTGVDQAALSRAADFARQIVTNARLDAAQAAGEGASA